MQATMASFLDLLGTANTQFVIPVYQRVYSWRRKDCEILWDDIIRAGRDNKPHFVGSVLYIQENNSPLTGMKKELLIDGQQRMTTLSLILAAFIEYLEEDESRADFLTDTKISFLRKSYLFNDEDLKGDARYKLILSQYDKETLFSITGDAAKPNAKSNLILDNFEYFRERMHGKSFDARVFWNGLSNIQVIDTELTAGLDDAQLIFESMNSKGKPLSPTDLIRNYVLMSLPLKEQTYLYESYWHPLESMFGLENDDEFNSFFWYWLWIKIPSRKPKEGHVYDEFKWFKKDEFDGNTEDLLKELLDYATYYSNMFLGKEADSELAVVFERICRLDVKQIRPIMLTLYANYRSGNLIKAAFVRTCMTLESFLFRRAVCGRLTTGLNHFFAGVYRDMDKQEDIATYVEAMLLIHSQNMTAYFPTDDYFAEALMTRDCYYRFPKTGYLLERLENAHRPKEPIRASGYQIEHILPQSIEHIPEWQQMLGPNWASIHEKYCNTIGNLTFTGYNPELSNKPFERKLNDKEYGFKFSPFYLNSLVAKESVWDKDAIERRAKILAQEAIKIWPYPQIPASVIDSFRPKKGKEEVTNWSIEVNHPQLAESGVCHQLFVTLMDQVEKDNHDWEQYVTRYYVGYRTGSRKLHLAIVGRKGNGGRLALGLPKTVDELDDPLCMCIDKRVHKGFGPGMPTLINMTSINQLDDVMNLINQC